MPKEAMIRARIEPELKQDVEAIFADLGLNPTIAITLFYTQVNKRRGLPFRIETPNTTTRKTFEKTDRGEELTFCKDADDMFQKLGI